MFFLWYLLIGLFAGWIANLIVRGGGTFGSIICSIIGAVVLLWIVSLIRPARKTTV